jgi:hypothetical protein
MLRTTCMLFAAVIAVTAAAGTPAVVHDSDGELACESNGIRLEVYACPPDDGVKRANPCVTQVYFNRVRSGLGALLASGRLRLEQLFAAFPHHTFEQEQLIAVFELHERPDASGRSVTISIEASAGLDHGSAEVDTIEIVLRGDVSLFESREAFFRSARVVEVRYAGTTI